MKTLIDRTCFYLTEDGVEEELGALLQLVMLDEPTPEDFLDVCAVLEYYSKNVLKALEDVRKTNTTICGDEEGTKLIALTVGGGYVAKCKRLQESFSEAYACELYYYTEDEL